MAAGSLAAGQSRVIGAAIPSMRNSSFYRYVLGMQNAVAEVGYKLVLMLAEGIEQERQAVHTLVGLRVEGIVLVGNEHQADTANLLSKTRTPVVESWALEDAMDMCVGYDTAEATRAMVRLHASQGRRRIALVVYEGAVSRRFKERIPAFEQQTSALGLAGDLVQHGARDIHAEANARRHVNGLPLVHARENAIKRGVAQLELFRVIPVHNRITADRGIGGERCDSGNARGTSMRQKPVQPIAIDDRIGVQENDIALRVQSHRLVAAPHKAEIGLVPQKRDEAESMKLLQLFRQVRLWRGIVDDHNFEGCLIRAGEDRMEAGKRVVPSAIDGHDDIDRNGTCCPHRPPPRMFGPDGIIRRSGLGCHLPLSPRARRAGAAPLLPPEAEVVLKRLHAPRDDIGVVSEVFPHGKAGPRIAPLGRTMTHVMHEGVHTARGHVPILCEVPAAVEDRVWLTPFLPAAHQIVKERIDKAAGDVGILTPVPFLVEEFRAAKKQVILEDREAIASAQRFEPYLHVSLEQADVQAP